jgi:hypothetical protein
MCSHHKYRVHFTATEVPVEPVWWLVEAGCLRGDLLWEPLQRVGNARKQKTLIHGGISQLVALAQICTLSVGR